jgi:anti-sigma B factor antagonist
VTPDSGLFQTPTTPALRLFPEPTKVAAVVEPLRCNVSQLNGTRVVAVRGEIDFATAPELDEVLGEFDRVQVVVDLAKVTFIDSSGLKSLVDARTRLRNRGGDLTVRSASPIVLRAFQITRLDETLLTASGPT